MTFIGVMDRVKGNFGFIKQDSGDDDMFVMPAQCQAFGGIYPEIGDRIRYDVVIDLKTGRPRADNVQPFVDIHDGAFDRRQDGLICNMCSGTMDREKGGFGFIKQDSGDEDMFVMPAQCVGFHFAFPPIGARVVYDVQSDPKTGRPRAENVCPEQDTVPAAVVSWQQPGIEHMHIDSPDNLQTGVMDRIKANFGFIKQDSGEEDMFVMPQQCVGFGGDFPPIGSRVAYVVVLDAKTGRPRAEDVRPEVTHHTGVMDRTKGKFGFIRQDSGEDDMFVMPAQCEAFDGAFPPIGTRVVYEIVLDAKTGLPRAQDVRPDMSNISRPQGGIQLNSLSNHNRTPRAEKRHRQTAQDPSPLPVWSGIMDRDKGSFGFIRLENGDEMFVMPASCAAFGGVLPGVAERVRFTVVQDIKTGRPRAEDVEPDVRQHTKRRKLDTSSLSGTYKSLEHIGTFDREKGTFGFIKQDSGEDDMFVMPAQCEAFDGVFPEIGTRVSYDIVLDAKTGKPRAENVKPLMALAGCHQDLSHRASGGVRYRMGSGINLANGSGRSPSCLISR